MHELAVTLRFLSPSLGRIRHADCDQFDRDGSGAVVFMPIWWTFVLAFGAQALGRQQHLVEKVRVHPRIEGTVSRFKRWWSDTQFTWHEAFLVGTSIHVNMLVPRELPLNDFIDILNKAGAYRGVSPYGWRMGYGRFEVADVTPTPRASTVRGADERPHTAK